MGHLVAEILHHVQAGAEVGEFAVVRVRKVLLEEWIATQLRKHHERRADVPAMRVLRRLFVGVHQGVVLWMAGKVTAKSG